MIQDVKLGNTKYVHNYMYAINKCAFLLSFYLEMPQQSEKNVGVERGVATRGAKVVIAIATNFEGFTRQQFSLGSNSEKWAFSPKI